MARFLTLALLILLTVSSSPQPPALWASGGSWRWLSSDGAPPPRRLHSAVWTGSEMIVWGGISVDGDFTPLNDGGRYDPAIDQWKSITKVGAPASRGGAAVFWSGSEMLVWGGAGASLFGDGFAYSPHSDTWREISRIGAPTARMSASSVWTGTHLIIWGGLAEGDAGATGGGSYDPATDSWSPVSSNGEPSPRYDAVTSWTGSEMIVSGGWAVQHAGLEPEARGGAAYNPVTDTWRQISEGGPLGPGEAVWTGSEMIVWKGAGGASYRPSLDAWRRITPAPATAERDLAESAQQVVWTGSDMVFWGGSSTARFRTTYSDGARYDPYTDEWVSLPTDESLPASFEHTLVWTGREVLAWPIARSERGAAYQP